MNDQDYRARHDALEIRIKSAWKQVDAAQDQETRALLWEHADKLQAELIELEQGSIRLSLDGRAITGDSIATWSAPDGSGDTLIELPDGKRFRQSGNQIRRLSPPSDHQRELQWWEDQYASKLSDLSGNREGRPMPTPEELRYFEDKITSLGGDVAKTAPTRPWIDYHDQLIKEWFDGERALIEDLYPSKPVKVEDPVFGPLARGVATAACMALPITAIIVLLVWLAKMIWGF